MEVFMYHYMSSFLYLQFTYHCIYIDILKETLNAILTIFLKYRNVSQIHIYYVQYTYTNDNFKIVSNLHHDWFPFSHFA